MTDGVATTVTRRGSDRNPRDAPRAAGVVEQLPSVDVVGVGGFSIARVAEVLNHDLRGHVVSFFRDGRREQEGS